MKPLPASPMCCASAFPLCVQGLALRLPATGRHRVLLVGGTKGLDLAGQKSKHLDMFAGRRFDWVISLCDRVREVCPEFPGAPQTIHWSIANPATGDSDDVTYKLFQQTAAELATRIDFLLALLAANSQKPRRSA